MAQQVVVYRIVNPFHDYNPVEFSRLRRLTIPADVDTTIRHVKLKVAFKWGGGPARYYGLSGLFREGSDWIYRFGTDEILRGDDDAPVHAALRDSKGPKCGKARWRIGVVIPIGEEVQANAGDETFEAGRNVGGDDPAAIPAAAAKGSGGEGGLARANKGERSDIDDGELSIESDKELTRRVLTVCVFRDDSSDEFRLERVDLDENLPVETLKLIVADMFGVPVSKHSYRTVSYDAKSDVWHCGAEEIFCSGGDRDGEPLFAALRRDLRREKLRSVSGGDGRGIPCDDAIAVRFLPGAEGGGCS